MPVFTYPALRCRQTPDGEWLALFAAPATDIHTWAGTPQKKKLGADADAADTLGFQRDLSRPRLRQLAEFYGDKRNIIQNPLLCAIKPSSLGSVEFAPNSRAADDDEPMVEHGQIRINLNDEFGNLSLLDIITQIRDALAKRLPQLRDRQPPSELLTRMSERASREGHDLPDSAVNDSQDPESESDEQGDDADADADGDTPALAAVVEDESHILDFWDELSACAQLLEDLGDGAPADSFLGYNRSALESFVKPAVVVDGQHRLEGALKAAQDELDDEPNQQEVARLIDSGHSPEEADRRVRCRLARNLPVSLLMAEHPAEHVFQFVIVNQKATPISRPLLGTIISTTLSNDELEPVRERLNKAGIPLEDSRAIASLTRDPRSPFYNKVERGLATEGSGELLAWSVFGGLVRMFKDLRGGILFGSRVDHADKWRRHHLNGSRIVQGWEEHYANDDGAYDYWHERCWRDAFVQFWGTIRDYFGNTSDDQAHNYWGRPRQSNLFNKISLTILAADFLQFLCDRGIGIDSADDVPSLVRDQWLDGVDPGYFNRNWRLEGVKKDSTGIRNRWAHVWLEYRKDPKRLPRVENYRSALSGA